MERRETEDLEKLFDHNRNWASRRRRDDPEFFHKLADAQVPEFLWIGCSDSRVPANEIIGLPPGEVFVHRNVGNVISLTDLNCLSVVEYAVQVLRVRHIIVCGHYGCGGIKAAMNRSTTGLVNHWLSPISEIFDTYHASLENLGASAPVGDKLCELSTVKQVRNLCRTSPVLEAWDAGQPLSIHGLIYGVGDGILHDLQMNVTGSGMADGACRLAVEKILSTPERVVDC